MLLTRSHLGNVAVVKEKAFVQQRAQSVVWYVEFESITAVQRHFRRKYQLWIILNSSKCQEGDAGIRAIRREICALYIAHTWRISPRHSYLLARVAFGAPLTPRPGTFSPPITSHATGRHECKYSHVIR